MWCRSCIVKLFTGQPSTIGSTLTCATMWGRAGSSLFLTVVVGIILLGSLCDGAPFDMADNEIARSSASGIAVKAPAFGTGVSSGFWDNTKPGSFERLFVPTNEEYEFLSTPQKKKAWFRMYKKAINARQFRLH